MQEQTYLTKKSNSASSKSRLQPIQATAPAHTALQETVVSVVLAVRIRNLEEDHRFVTQQMCRNR